ncbi:MAG TPA: RHS repeat-associated core domain-containing protein [Humisphaera sp.]
MSGYWEASPDLLTDPGEPADAELEGLRDAEGLITTTTYGASNAATSTVAGDALGQVKSVSVRQGEAGTPVKQQEYTYLQRTGGSVTTYPAATSTVYRNDNGTGGQTTTFAYTWFSGTVQPQTVTTTLPTVTTAQNGSNAAAAVVTVLDPYGRPVWMRDADGFISYTEYDAATGAVTKAIADVATSLVSNEPSGWTTPAGGGRHLVTEFEVDRLGRTTKVTDPTGTLTYVVYKDADREVRTYRGFVATTSTSGTVAGPVEVTREDRGNKYTETLTMSPTVAVSGSRPTGGETIANVQSLARTFVNDLGQVSETRVYTSMPAGGYSTSPSLGTAGANYLVTEYGYDARGRQNRVATPDGTKRRTLYDGLGRVASTWVGTDDSYATDTYAGGNMVMVTENTYDAGGVGDSNLTLARTYGDSASYDAVFGYDWRNRGTDRRGPDGVATKATLDNLGQVTTTETYADADADFVIDSGELRGKGEAAYDERGRVYQAVVHEVSPTTGSIGHRLTTKYWYDARGNTVKTADPNGLFNKTRYDGTGLATATFLSFDTAETAYADADDVTGDMVVEQHKTIFDKDDNAVTTVAYSRLDGDTTTNGELTAGNSYVQVAVNWYDTLGRPTGAATYGRDNGLTRYVFNTSNALIDADSDGLPDEAEGSARTPNSSDDYIVSKTEYDAAGRAYRSTDNKGHVTQRVLDLAGRTLKTVENYVDGTAAETETEADRTTETVYDASGRVDKLVAYNPKGLGNGVEHQETKYLYESTVDGSWVTSTIYPDSADTDSSGTDQVKSTLDRLGRATTTTDQRGVVHTYTYDAAGRLETDAVTTLPSGVDGSIRRIDTAYDDLSRPRLVTSYAEDYGSTVVNEFQNTYDGWGNVAKSEQAHDGPVTTGTPAVEYTYEDGAVSGEAKYVRLSKVTYPNGRQVHYNLPSDTIGQKLVRLGNIAADGSGTTKYAAYTYLGAGAVTTVTHPAVSGGLTLSYGSAGTYAGWDRFGRTVLQQWKDGSGTVLDGFAYTYGRDSNRLSRTPTAAGAPAALTEQYSYDGLGRLVETRRGTPGTSGHISTPDQLWTYRLDVQGNQWQYITATSPTPGDVNLDGRINASDKSRVQGAMGRSEGIRWTDGDVDEDGVVTSADLAIVQGLSGYSGGNAGVTQDRTHDAANEITGTSGNSPAWAATAYDAAGNMTAGPKSQEETTLLHRTYDGWNRLTGVFADDGYGAAATQLVAYEHDGRGFRIERTEDPAGTPARDDLYYNEGWQVLEVRRDGDTDPREQWVWDPRYVDAAVVRFLDANLDGDVADVGDSTLYPTQDANFNVTGLVNASTGSVVERYAYDPYGEVTVLDANFTPDADGVSDCTWNILYQGRKWDALTHDYDARNREYSSSIGRWTQRDPQGYVDGMSLYENVMSRPTGLTDPYGTDSHSGTIALDANPSGFTISRFEGAEHTFFQIPKMQVEVDFTMNGDQPDWPLLITGVRPTGKLPDLSAVYSIDDRIATDQNNFGVRAAAKRVFTNVVISFVVKVQRKLARDLTGKVCVRYRFSGGWKVTAQETRRSGNQQETVTVESRITFPDPLEPNEMILDGRKPPKNRRVPDMRDARWEDYREEVIELKRGPVPATQPTTRPATQPAPQPPKPAGGQGNAPRRRPAAATRPG